MKEVATFPHLPYCPNCDTAGAAPILLYPPSPHVPGSQVPSPHPCPPTLLTDPPPTVPLSSWVPSLARGETRDPRGVPHSWTPSPH